MAGFLASSRRAGVNAKPGEIYNFVKMAIFGLENYKITKYCRKVQRNMLTFH